MRDCAARAKPMTATATRMVKAIWHAYFVRTGNQLPGTWLAGTLPLDCTQPTEWITSSP